MDNRYLWSLDQKINDTGMLLNLPLIHGAMQIDAQMREGLLDRMQTLTGMANPNSRDQLMQWLDTAGVTAVDVTKKTVEKLLAAAPTEQVEEVLRLRQSLARSSIAKYDAALRASNTDGRVRGLFQFAGAGRTGRWTGKIFQPQNLPRPPKWMEDWTEADYLAACDVVATGDYALATAIYGEVPDLLAALLRCVIRAPEGQRLVIADFSAIEARVLAWLAREAWRMEVFSTHGKIYEASAAQMFKVDITKIKKGNPEYALRQKGKVAELALGYQGGSNALVTMGALDMGLKEVELPEIVQLWREANINICKYWYAVQDAAKATISTGKKSRVRNVGFELHKIGGHHWLHIVLPSGRPMRYYKPWLEADKIWFWGVNSMTKKWEKISTFGGRLVENIVQATSRDLLAHALIQLDDAGYNIVGHVHDEVIAEQTEGDGKGVERMEELMGEPPEWAADLPLGAAGYATSVYRKE